MEQLAAVEEVLLEAALVAEAAVSMTGPQERVMLSTLAPPRRPTGAGAVAAARMGVEVAVVVALVRDRRAVLPGGSTIARTAPGAGKGLSVRLSDCRSLLAGFIDPASRSPDPYWAVCKGCLHRAFTATKWRSVAVLGEEIGVLRVRRSRSKFPRALLVIQYTIELNAAVECNN